MIGGKRWAIKKFLRGYAVTIVTTALLVLILALLVWARLGDLYSVRDISKINPLITSGQNELIAAKDANGLTRIVKEDESSAQSDKMADSSKGDVPAKSNTSQGSQPSGGTGSGNTGGSSEASAGSGSSGSGTGSGSGGGGTGGTGGGTGGGDTSPPRAFTASISSVSQTTSTPLVNLGACKITHNFSATLAGQNAPGTVTYRWKQSNGVTSPQRVVSFTAGDTSKTVAADPWETSGTSGSYSMTFEMLSPSASSRTVNFTHSCPLVGGGF